MKEVIQMLTKEGLLTMLDHSEEYCEFLYIYPMEVETETLVNRLKSVYPKMQDAEILYDDTYIFIPYTCENYGALTSEIKQTIWELTAAEISVLTFDITKYGKYEYHDKISETDKTTVITR